jgi:hypothetical protein
MQHIYYKIFLKEKINLYYDFDYSTGINVNGLIGCSWYDPLLLFLLFFFLLFFFSFFFCLFSFFFWPFFSLVISDGFGERGDFFGVVGYCDLLVVWLWVRSS